MRKFILLAGTAFSLAATPAMACDWHLMGGPQRFNPLAKYQPDSSPDASESTETASDYRAPAEPEQPAQVIQVATEPAPAAENKAPSGADSFR